MVVTAMMAEPAGCGGIVSVICVSVRFVGITGTPSTVTAAPVKPVPVRCTTVPPLGSTTFGDTLLICKALPAVQAPGWRSSDQLTSEPVSPGPRSDTFIFHVPFIGWPMNVARGCSGRNEPVKGAPLATIAEIG